LTLFHSCCVKIDKLISGIIAKLSRIFGYVAEKKRKNHLSNRFSRDFHFVSIPKWSILQAETSNWYHFLTEPPKVDMDIQKRLWHPNNKGSKSF